VEIPSTGERIVRRPPEIRKKAESSTPHTEALSTGAAAGAKSAAEAAARAERQREQEETEATAAAAAIGRVKLEHDAQKCREEQEEAHRSSSAAESAKATAAADAWKRQEESAATTAAQLSDSQRNLDAEATHADMADRRTVQEGTEAAGGASHPATAAPTAHPLLMSSEELSVHVSSLSDMSSQLSLLQSAVGSYAYALSPLSAEHARQQTQLAALRVIHGCTSAREYYLHVRLLLTCAHTGAAAVRSGNVESSGSSAAAAGKMAVEQLPKMIAKGLGKAAESIPLLGAGASALTALISTADARSLNVELQRLIRLAHTPTELSALVDTLARKLTLLQWPTLRSTTELQRTVNGSGFRAWAVKVLNSFEADAMYLVKGERYLRPAEKCALADVETIVAAVAQGEISCECPPHVVGEEARAEWLALQILRHVLPGKKSYEEELPTTAVAAAASASASASASAAAAAQSPSPSPVCSLSPSALPSPSAVVSASLSVSVSAVLSPSLPASQQSPDSIALLMAEMAAMRTREAEREAARMEKDAAHAAELAQMKADADAQKAAAAKQRKALAAQAALIKKLQEQQNPDAVDAGGGLAFPSASVDPTGRRSVRSPQEQQEANQRSLAQMQQQISELTSLVTQLHMRAEEEDGEGRQRAGSAARREEEARKELNQLKQQFHRKQSKRAEGNDPRAEDEYDEDDVGV
jgi:hypothetical protein